MLERIAHLASLLYRLRLALWIGAGLAGAIAIVGILRSSESQLIILPALLVVLWSLLLLAIGYSMSQLPGEILANDGWRLRAKKRLLRGLFGLLFAVSLVIAAMLLISTFRAIGLALDA